MRQKFLLIAALLLVICSGARSQVYITVPSGPDTVVCNGAPLTLQAVNNGYHSHSVSLSIDDGYSVLEPIGFSFNWYGTTYTNFVISSNGFVTFNSSLASGASPWSIGTGIPGNVNCKNSVLGVYMDLYLPAGGTVTYGVAGVAPNRKCVINFCNVHYFSCTAKYATFQIILYETTNVAEVHMKHKDLCTTWNSGAGIEGVENSTALTATVAPGRNYPGTWTVTVPDARRFTPSGSTYICDTIPYNPIPDSAATISWYSGSTLLGTGSSVTVNPSVPTTYQAMAVTCSDTSLASASVTIGNGPVISGLPFTNPSVCGACDGSITIKGLDPGSSDTINYTYNGVPQPTVVAVPDAAGNVYLTNLCSGTYGNFTDKVGYCVSSVYGPDNLVDPPFIVSFASSTQPSVCGACDGSITFTGLIPGTNDTLNYSYGGVPQPPVYFVADASGTYTLSGLCAGNYSNITFKMNYCISPAIGPFAIINPAFAISSFTHTNTSCSMCDGTITLYGLPPGQIITVNYDFMGSPATPVVLTSTAAGTVTLTNLCYGPSYGPGVYTNITASVNTCTTTPVGPIDVLAPPLIPIALIGSTPPSECGACNGSVTIKVFNAPGVIDTVFYTLNGVAQPPALYAAAPDSTLTLYNLCGSAAIGAPSAVYNNFFIKVGPCPTTTLNTPVTFVDSPMVADFTDFVHYGCNGDTIYFVNTSHSAGAANLYYTWNFGDGTSDTVANPMHIYTTQGTYTVTLTTSNHNAGCSNSVTQVFNLNHPIKAIFNTTNTISDSACQYEAIAINNTSIGTPPTYVWSFGDGSATSTVTTPSHAYAHPGTYVIQLIATNFVPCSDTAYKTVYIDSQSSATTLSVSDTIICRGTYITFGNDVLANGLLHYTWNFGDGDSVQNVNPVIYAYNTTGTFTVTETAYYHTCQTVVASHEITVVPQPTINLGNDTSICEGGGDIILMDNINSGNPLAEWLWNTGATSSAISVSTAGNYFATVTLGNCSASDSVNIANDCYMAMPNVFTPNGDGVNDYFYPRQYLSRGLMTFQMDIYNRWGQLVFSTSTVDGRGWDGMFNGTQQPEGVYIFIIDATFKDGKKEHHQGNITLLR